MALQSEDVPDQWNINVVTMIPKKGDLKNIENYRGISLVNTLSKLFLKIFATRFMEKNRQENFIRRNQLGFMKNEEGISEPEGYGPMQILHPEDVPDLTELQTRATRAHSELPTTDSFDSD